MEVHVSDKNALPKLITKSTAENAQWYVAEGAKTIVQWLRSIVKGAMDAFIALPLFGFALLFFVGFGIYTIIARAIEYDSQIWLMLPVFLLALPLMFAGGILYLRHEYRVRIREHNLAAIAQAYKAQPDLFTSADTLLELRGTLDALDNNRTIDLLTRGGVSMEAEIDGRRMSILEFTKSQREQLESDWRALAASQQEALELFTEPTGHPTKKLHAPTSA